MSVYIQKVNKGTKTVLNISLNDKMFTELINAFELICEKCRVERVNITWETMPTLKFKNTRPHDGDIKYDIYDTILANKNLQIFTHTVEIGSKNNCFSVWNIDEYKKESLRSYVYIMIEDPSAKLETTDCTDYLYVETT